MPSPEGEIACLIDAVLDVNGKELGLITVHFGNDRDKLDRYLQAEATRNLVSAHGDRPVLWLGYLVDYPGGENYKKMISAGLVDSAPNEMRRWCLYIFSKGLVQGASCWDISGTTYLCIGLPLQEMPNQNKFCQSQTFDWRTPDGA